MRRLIIFIAFMLSVNIYCQNNVAVGISQDIKLALAEDDYGNTPFTLDMIVEVGYEVSPIGRDYIKVYAQHERAELSGGLYTRNAVGLAYGFKILNTHLEPSVNVGNIHRFGYKFQSIELKVSWYYNITRNISTGFVYNYTHRKDVDVWRSNAGFGIKYHIYNLKDKRYKRNY